MIAGEGNEDIQSGLSRLKAAEFIYEARLFPDVGLYFKHALDARRGLWELAP